MSNGVYICLACHEWIESHRRDAFVKGWLLQSWESPLEVGLCYRGDEWVRLTDDGGMEPAVAKLT